MPCRGLDGVGECVAKASSALEARRGVMARGSEFDVQSHSRNNHWPAVEVVAGVIDVLEIERPEESCMHWIGKL